RYEGLDLIKTVPDTFTHLPFQMDGTKTVAVKFSILNPRVIGLDKLEKNVDVKFINEKSILSGSVLLTKVKLLCNFTLDSELENRNGRAVLTKEKVGIDVSFHVSNITGTPFLTLSHLQVHKGIPGSGKLKTAGIASSQLVQLYELLMKEALTALLKNALVRDLTSILTSTLQI
ncbi:unnamed protein product, partial [Meganyctiphanes norvegica]